jgi:putative addiction module component (TIGR02574 family)
MSQSFSNFDVFQLDAAQKLELIGTLWDSLGDNPDALPMPEWHREILAERIAEADASPDDAVPLEEALARLRRQP